MQWEVAEKHGIAPDQIVRRRANAWFRQHPRNRAICPRANFGTKNEAFDVQWGFRYLCTTSYWQLGNFAETILVLQSVSVVTL